MASAINAGVQETNSSPHQVLFICTGNFYRSRFAESLFNQKAREAHQDWRAISRGLQLVASQHGISSLARHELAKRGVPERLYQGAPKELRQEDLENSGCIIVMNEAEHRGMLEKQFPFRDDRKIRYWHIAEAAKMSPANACEEMSKQVGELLQTLKR